MRLLPYWSRASTQKLTCAVPCCPCADQLACPRGDGRARTAYLIAGTGLEACAANHHALRAICLRRIDMHTVLQCASYASDAERDRFLSGHCGGCCDPVRAIAKFIQRDVAITLRSHAHAVASPLLTVAEGIGCMDSGNPLRPCCKAGLTYDRSLPYVRCACNHT